MAQALGNLACHLRVVSLLVAGSFLLASPGLAAAHDPAPIPAAAAMTAVPGPAPSDVAAVAGPGTRAVDNDLYRVTPATGPALLTHGPDTRESMEVRAADALAPDGTGFGPGALERQPVCATDFYQRVIYANVAGTPSRGAELTAEIRHVVGRMDAVLNSESIASGGPGADYKVLCDSSGQVQVDSLTVPGATFAEVVAAARTAGLGSSRSSNLIFLDGTLGGSCGIASYESDQRLSIDNRSNVGGGWAVVYGPCWNSPTPMHESAHMMGAVQYSAPNSTGSGGHCNEANDVMCYSPDGGDRNQSGMVLRCAGRASFDCGYDDYFDSAPEPGEYLDSHWNLGSSLNRFIALASPAAAQEAAAAAAATVEQPMRHHGRKRGTSGEPGTWDQFAFKVPRHVDAVQVRLFAGPGADLGLYAQRRAHPTADRFACREVLKANHATCLVEGPDPGRWFAGVLSRGGRIGAGFKISVKVKR